MLSTSLYGVRARIYDSTGKKLFTSHAVGKGNLTFSQTSPGFYVSAVQVL